MTFLDGENQAEGYQEKTVSEEERADFVLLFSELSREYNHAEIARIYDKILARVQSLLYPLGKNHNEYWEDQKMLYNLLVRKVINLPEVVSARERFKVDLEDFFRKRPMFQWRGLGLKELIDLAINIPLSLDDLSKIILTKAGQLIVAKVENRAHALALLEYPIQDNSTSCDGHIMSSTREVFLPFLRFVRSSNDYDHPVFLSLYAYLMLVFDILCSIFQNAQNKRSQNLLRKLIPLREELSAVAHMPRPPENLRASVRRLFAAFIGKRPSKIVPPTD